MKKRLVILCSMVIILLVGIVVYFQLPQWLVRGGLYYLKETEYTAILDSNKLDLDEDQRVIAQEVLNTLEYTVGQTHFVENEAWVEAEFEVIDIPQLIIDERNDILKNTLSDWRRVIDDLVNDRVQGTMTRLLATILTQTKDKDRPTKRLSVEIPFVRSYLGWKLDIDDQWVKKVLTDYLN